MRIPKRPPNWLDIANELIQVNRFWEIAETVRLVTKAERYLHWDKLRLLKPPKNLTHSEWWCGLKYLRSSQFREVNLLDLKNRPFRYTMVDPIPKRLHEIDLGAGGHIAMPEQVTNPDTKNRYLVNSLIEEAVTSSQLEGATTTRKVARDMIRAGRVPRDRSEQMILNNFLTMQRIGKLRHTRLTKELVFEIHNLVTKDTLDKPDGAGRFRTQDEKHAVYDMYNNLLHQPPPAEQLHERMEAMCAFANNESDKAFAHPVIRSIILHFWLAYDHPFIDGNGRTARALFYWSMLHYGYWLCEFISISEIILKAPARYGKAFLYTETDDNDLTYFILHHLGIIQRAVETLHDYVKRKTQEVQKIEREIQSVAQLNHRQRAIVARILRHPNERYTIDSHRRSHGVVYQTARADLLYLRDQGLLDAYKVGREWHFKPVSDFAKRLTNLA